MNINLNENQRLAVEHKKGALLIIAGAGTGKTAVITQRIRHFILETPALKSGTSMKTEVENLKKLAQI